MKKLWLFLLFCVMLSSSAYSEVEVFSTYNTDIILNSDDTLEVHKEIFLRNVHDVAIIPGQVDFKILTSNDVEVLEYTIKDRYDQEINSNIIETNEFSIIQTKIFTPLLPGFEYKLDLYYKLSLNPKGIFFKKLQIPLKENTRIPIKSGVINLEIPESYHYTALSYKDNSTIIESNKASWEINEETPDILNFEYSYLPITLPGVSGSLIFWILINVILIIILIKEVRKEVQKYHKK
ncbi:MAG: hypothetical protein PF569_00820 [Candidatus Woesearchaeota archaeon]|nr:hypothetical protein [Candidatus Woesearchaeota archaeon]